MKGWLDLDASRFQTGKGWTIAQHGELFLGQIEDETNQYRSCLLSLPCRAFHSKATFRPDTSGVLQVNPSGKCRAQKVAELTLVHLKARDIGGELSIESEVPETRGYGSSTADCVAAAIATADSLRVNLTQEQLARLVANADIVSGSLMFRRAVLFEPRRGGVLEDYTKQLPRLEVLGVDTASEEQVKIRNHYLTQYT